MTSLSAEEKLAFCSHIREAIFHLASCWDALRQAESMIEGEIETDQISGITSNLDDPEDAFAIDDKEIEEALAGEITDNTETELPAEVQRQAIDLTKSILGR